jgi:hypothetical protein
LPLNLLPRLLPLLLPLLLLLLQLRLLLPLLPLSPPRSKQALADLQIAPQ